MENVIVKQAWNFYKRVHKPGVIIRFEIEQETLCLPKTYVLEMEIEQDLYCYIKFHGTRYLVLSSW